MKQRIGFARWRSDLASGGNRYDDELAVALRALGLDVREYPVPGSWPVPKQQERERLSGLLAADRWQGYAREALRIALVNLDARPAPAGRHGYLQMTQGSQLTVGAAVLKLRLFAGYEYAGIRHAEHRAPEPQETTAVAEPAAVQPQTQPTVANGVTFTAEQVAVLQQ